jgi:integrase
VGGVAGLHLQVGGPKSRSWILRTTVGGKRCDLGLGSFPEISLAKARERAVETKDSIRKGVDPVSEKKARRSAAKLARDTAMTFSVAAEKYIASHEKGWRNGKHTDQWRNTIETYAVPVIGKVLVREVATAHLVRILEPIWNEKNETAIRLRGRIEAILDWGTVRGFRQGDNPAKWRGCLDKLLPKINRSRRIQHHPAIPVGEVGAFMRDLREIPGASARCLEFLTLTASRSGEARGARWIEIDLNQKVWTVPPDRMKAGKAHQVPLSDRAIALLENQEHMNDVDLVFPNPKGERLSDMALTATMRRMGLEAVPHGLRSTFRDWCGERTYYARDVVERSLAHGLESKTEAAYFRSDLFQKRIRLMRDWGKFLDKVEASIVIKLRLAA